MTQFCFCRARHQHYLNKKIWEQIGGKYKELNASLIFYQKDEHLAFIDIYYIFQLCSNIVSINQQDKNDRHYKQD